MCHGHTATMAHVGTQSLFVESWLNISERQGKKFLLASEIFLSSIMSQYPRWARAIELGGHSFEALEYLLEKDLRGAAWEVF